MNKEELTKLFEINKEELTKLFVIFFDKYEEITNEDILNFLNKSIFITNNGIPKKKTNFLLTNSIDDETLIFLVEYIKKFFSYIKEEYKTKHTIVENVKKSQTTFKNFVYNEIYELIMFWFQKNPVNLKINVKANRNEIPNNGQPLAKKKYKGELIKKPSKFSENIIKKKVDILYKISKLKLKSKKKFLTEKEKGKIFSNYVDINKIILKNIKESTKFKKLLNQMKNMDLDIEELDVIKNIIKEDNPIVFKKFLGTGDQLTKYCENLLYYSKNIISKMKDSNNNYEPTGQQEYFLPLKWKIEDKNLILYEEKIINKKENFLEIKYNINENYVIISGLKPIMGNYEEVLDDVLKVAQYLIQYKLNNTCIIYMKDDMYDFFEEKKNVKISMAQFLSFSKKYFEFVGFGVPKHNLLKTPNNKDIIDYNNNDFFHEQSNEIAKKFYEEVINCLIFIESCLNTMIYLNEDYSAIFECYYYFNIFTKEKIKYLNNADLLQLKNMLNEFIINKNIYNTYNCVRYLSYHDLPIKILFYIKKSDRNDSDRKDLASFIILKNVEKTYKYMYILSTVLLQYDIKTDSL